jgi:ABC-type multidrug transport system ATPase subunit
MTSIDLRSVRKGFGGDCIVREASATFTRGVHLIEGENGAGKTTLLRMLSGSILPTCGEVLLDGVSVHRRKVRERGRIVMVSAEPAFYDGASVEFALRMYRAVCGLPSTRDIFEGFDPFLLSTKRAVAFGDLSLGWKKRLTLHMAFMCDVDVVVLDEPTVGLDDSGVDVLAALIRGRSAGRMTFFTSHEAGWLEDQPMGRYLLDRRPHGSVLVTLGDADCQGRYHSH